MPIPHPRYGNEIVPGLPHHIIHRGNNRRRLFSYPVERWSFLHLVADAGKRAAVAVHAFCLFDNHVHLIATPPSVKALSNWVADFARLYATRRNRARGGSGKLFEQTFFRRPLSTDDELGVVTTYVDLNRVRAGLRVATATDPWSSSALHLGGARANDSLIERLWTPSPWYLGLGNAPAERAARYVEWIAASESQRAAYAQGLRAAEARLEPYRRRLRRPDGLSAREPTPPYGVDGIETDGVTLVQET